MEGHENTASAIAELPFNKQMRKATREVHAISDALVNAKLAFALSSSDVWADGLLVFYEVFRFLEDAMVRLKGSPVAELRVNELMRTEAFEKDLTFFLGPDWSRDYTPRESVINYIMHLREVERKDPNLLIAYVYHLYMGLLSGGQILRQKRALVSKILPFSNAESRDGDAVTDFGEHNILTLKQRFIHATNSAVSTMDDDSKKRLLEESKKVFLMNNEIIKSVHGTNIVLMRKALYVSLFVFILLLIYNFVFL